MITHTGGKFHKTENACGLSQQNHTSSRMTHSTQGRFCVLKFSQPDNVQEEAVLALIILLFTKCTLPGSLPARFDAFKLSQEYGPNNNSKSKCRDWLYAFKVLFIPLTGTCFKGSNVMHALCNYKEDVCNTPRMQAIDRHAIYFKCHI